MARGETPRRPGSP